MLLSYFNLCQASRPGEVGARLRRAIVAGECIPPRYAALHERERERERATEPVPRKHRRKNDRAPPFARAFSARSIHRVSIFSAFSLRSSHPTTRPGQMPWAVFISLAR